MTSIDTLPIVDANQYTREEVTPVIGGISVADSLKTNLADIKIMPKDREKHFTNADTLNQVAIGCGDERCVCQESLSGLEIEDGNLEFFIRCFGGPFGLAHTLMLNRANINEYDNISLKNGLSSHKSAVGLVISRLNDAGIVPMLHSDNGSENGNIFKSDGEPDVGCAFAKKLGLITNLMNRQYVVETTEAYINSHGGDAREISNIMEAKLLMVESGIDENFNYTREDYKALVANVVVLNGAHKTAEDTALVLNYTSKVSRPAPGEEAFYDVDALQIASILIELFPEIDFEASTLLASIELQSITTAHALALGTRREGSTLEMLPIEVFGDRAKALAEIQQKIDSKKAD